jgi:hypothetical protein
MGCRGSTPAGGGNAPTLPFENHLGSLYLDWVGVWGWNPLVGALSALNPLPPHPLFKNHLGLL